MLTLRASLPVTPPPPSSVVPPLRFVWMPTPSNVTVSKPPLEPHHTLPLRKGCHTAPVLPKVPRSNAPTRPVSTSERSNEMVENASPSESSNEVRCQIPWICGSNVSHDINGIG